MVRSATPIPAAPELASHEPAPDRRAIDLLRAMEAIEGLAIAESSGAATRALMELFRAEKDPALQRVIVQRLGLLRSDEAQDLLIEALEDRP